MVTPGALATAFLPDTLTVHGMIFYAVTAAAYLMLPFMRRGDIAMVAMWLVLAAGVEPCFKGEELSAPKMFADMAGVALAAAPIYIARFRQIAQGDMRSFRRRGDEVETGAAIEGAPAAA